jgi:hypothetical protein
VRILARSLLRKRIILSARYQPATVAAEVATTIQIMAQRNSSRCSRKLIRFSPSVGTDPLSV